MTDKDDSGDVNMHDLTVVALTRNAPETMFLLDVLEESGIPATTQDDKLYPSGDAAHAGRICVPRAFVEQARTAIEKARAEAEQRGIEQAFDADSVADNTREAEKDPVLAEMFLLRDAGPDKGQQLKAFVAGWIIQGLVSKEIARYLAAAGLSLDEADALVATVAAEKEAEIRQSRQRLKVWGGILVFVAVAHFGYLAGIGNLSVRPTIILLVIGLVMIHAADRPVARFRPPE